MKRMLDLFSGLKGASQAFLDHPDWEVVTVDNNPDLEPDHVIDLSDYEAVVDFFMLYPPGHFDLIWASPPCIEFFQVNAPWCENYGEPPDMRLVHASMHIIKTLEPPIWVLENTINGLRYIPNCIGDFRQKIGPFYLWGNFPLLPNVRVPESHKADVDTWSDNPLRSNIKAKIPLDLSEALLKEIQRQSTLF